MLIRMSAASIKRNVALSQVPTPGSAVRAAYDRLMENGHVPVSLDDLLAGVTRKDLTINRLRQEYGLDVRVHRWTDPLTKRPGSSLYYLGRS